MFDMYQENILDHSRKPRNWGLLDDYTHHAHDDNPLCGDQLEITLKVDEEGIIRALGWAGNGCAISQASASMLGQELLGKPLSYAKEFDKDRVFELIGIPLSAQRVKCALLSLKVVKAASYNIERWESEDDEED